ncbi:O-succinylhomoserine sulfhydrylase [Neisseria leonii]|uniref:O-succinylhomoserine sulfhydrylase n=1 Tax=Neisseria leonii TaxID=2995413 RepID=UPI00237C0A90|nr:O-succinylhomoserine sulfhydrylase [Neisseria sp. 3986]MDD9324772.1 O-succinylhomoserine sulfhydrylase [Neisseria sp. 3986]
MKTTINDTLHPETLAIRGAQERTGYNEHNQALFITSSFMFDSAEEGAALFAGQKQGYTYSRTANPTVTAFAKRAALLEGAEQAVATATGMAAVQAALLTFLSAGDHLVCSRSLFGTTMGFLTNHVQRFGIDISFVSQTDVAEWRAAVRPDTKMFFLETPSNPLNEVADLQALADLAHESGALLAVDNSFLTPALQQPLRWGADLSIQSATKAVDGQGRVHGGVVAGSAELMKQVQMYMNAAGIPLSPFHAWVLLSGIETLALRMEKQCASADKLADWLRRRPQVKQVFHAGFADHPQADLVEKQQKSGGIVVAFEVDGGQEAAWRLIDRVRLFSRTANLGDVRSTITHPWTTTHGRMSAQAKQEAGIPEGLVRISVGMEHTDDLIADLQQALAQ